MSTFLKALEARLNDDQKDVLDRIYEPTVVATPLDDSFRSLCALPNGELRAYGYLYADRHLEKGGQIAYLSSMDAGLTWQIHYAHGKMNTCTYIEKGNVYLSASESSINGGVGEKGLYIFRSTIGPDDPNPEIFKLESEQALLSRPTLPEQSRYSNRIWFTGETAKYPLFYYSDDLGKTWVERVLPDPHCFETVYPHKGLRWCKGSGTEPIVVEVEENTLWMIIRTPMDCFYQSTSTDGGDTWSTPEPTTFYGTDTTAFLLKLEDGRIVTFWNNTKPLPQPNTAKAAKPDNGVINGYGENGFTNRDASHVAIIDGGRTIGYRELLLNPIRNRADFRYIGGIKSSADKSVHQFQAIQLPFNKVLVSVGQHTTARRLVIFDIDWLYETSRKEDFLMGLENVTIHTYLNSISGCHRMEVGNGHCSLNRTYSAYPVPDPEGSVNEVLQVAKYHDPRKINDISGMCWNFPMSKQGRVSVQLKIAEKQARFILSDRWYNTCDPFAATQSPFWFELDVTDVEPGYNRVDIDYDTEAGSALLSINDTFLCKVAMTTPCPTGLSYLIMQCATDGDSEGFYIRSMEKVEK